MQSNIPPEVNQKLAHIRSFLRRGEALRALESLCVLLEIYQPRQLMQRPRLEIEANLRDVVGELQQQAPIKLFLKEVSRSDNAFISYTPGNEASLIKLLRIIIKGLQTQKELEEKAGNHQKAQRRQELWEKGKELILSGDAPKGKMQLRRLLDEYPEDLELLLNTADLFREQKLYAEATELYEKVIEQAPKTAPAYAGLISCFLELVEYEKAEELYNRHIKQFGQHPRTLVNLANLYLKWGKRAQAAESAELALSIDRENAEAKAIIESLERRNA